MKIIILLINSHPLFCQIKIIPHLQSYNSLIFFKKKDKLTPAPVPFSPSKISLQYCFSRYRWYSFIVCSIYSLSLYLSHFNNSDFHFQDISAIYFFRLASWHSQKLSSEICIFWIHKYRKLLSFVHVPGFFFLLSCIPWAYPVFNLSPKFLFYWMTFSTEI